jgi:hypothetical protein
MEWLSTRKPKLWRQIQNLASHHRLDFLKKQVDKTRFRLRGENVLLLWPPLQFWDLLKRSFFNLNARRTTELFCNGKMIFCCLGRYNKATAIVKYKIIEINILKCCKNKLKQSINEFSWKQLCLLQVDILWWITHTKTSDLIKEVNGWKRMRLMVIIGRAFLPTYLPSKHYNKALTWIKELLFMKKTNKRPFKLTFKESSTKYA